MRDDRFEWDDRKAAANLKKHGVSFEVARRVFDDAAVLERLDDREDYGEERWTAIGLCSGRLVDVSYTMRGERIRILSAWKASKNEQDKYYRQGG